MTPKHAQSSTPSAARRVRRLLTYLRPARWHFAGGVLAGLAFAAISGFGLPMMLYTVAPVIFADPGAQNAKTEVVAEWARRLFGAAYQEQLLLVACLGLPVVFFCRGLTAFLNRYWLNYAGFQLLETLRTEVFRRLQELPLAFYLRHKSGDLTARLMTDTEQLKNVVVMMSTDALKQPFTLVGAFSFLLYLAITNRSALFVLVTLTSIPLCIVPIRILARRLIKKSRQLTAETGELNAIVVEGLQSPMEIQAYNLQPQLSARFAASVRKIFRLAMKTVKYQAFVNPVIEFLSACGFAAALYFGFKNGMKFEVFLTMGVALYMAYEPVKKLSILNAVWKMGAASLERLEQVLDAEDTVPQPARPVPLPAAHREIAFEAVSFTYPLRPADRAPVAALSQIHARFQAGEVVALVGPSGAGKSTFISLIPRFYDPTLGRITLAGVDLRQLDKQVLRAQMALVPQMPVLFNASIADNIRAGRPTATDAEVREAARKAFAADFITTLPQAYNTLVGERGTTLSGGQRQRIAIARAFLKNAPILLLDEATSALDAESEQKVQQALQELVLGRTTFLIAHRFSSLNLATRILVFEAGRITGDGPPAELGRTHAAFQHMLELQQLK
ncbi:MAG TPA: ABC transporter ATP-binding protein [Verrucomicrobiota bacterium]|nr:ABC transporter ATP-binding protein [Verrucomicrobiota bacterium]HNT14541.1 ABC transporter ATP-binding protein [Verrucomicrobiota bacterium]